MFVEYYRVIHKSGGKMKKFLSVLLVLAIAVGIFAACGGSDNAADQSVDVAGEDNTSGEENGEKIHIGVALPDFQDKWLSYLRDAIEEEAENYPNYDFQYSDGMNDNGKQLGQVEDFISNGVDGIILIAVNTETAGPITSACAEANIPLVVANRLLDNQEDATVYVGGDSIESGIIQAEKVAEMLDGKGTIGILMGLPANDATVKRTDGNMQVFDEYPDIEVVVTDYANWNRDEAMEVTENWIQSGLEFDAIVSNNDEMAIGAAIALEGQGIRDQVLVAGIDATIDALEFMEEGRLDISVFQDPFGQGAGSVKAMAQAIDGTLDTDEVFIPYELVMPEQIEEYKARWQ